MAGGVESLVRTMDLDKEHTFTCVISDPDYQVRVPVWSGVCLYPVSLCVCDVCVIAVSLVCEVMGSNLSVCAVNKSTYTKNRLSVKMVIFDLLFGGRLLLTKR